MKRLVSENGKDFFEVKVTGEREIYIDGILYAGKKLNTGDENMLNKVIDSFEDGGNRYEDGYEVYEYSKFVIKRKVERK